MMSDTIKRKITELEGLLDHYSDEDREDHSMVDVRTKAYLTLAHEFLKLMLQWKSEGDVQ